MAVILAGSCSDSSHTRDGAAPKPPSSALATTAPSTTAPSSLLDPVAAAVVAFARNPSPERFEALPLSDTVELQFRGQAVATVSAPELRDATRWSIQTDDGRASPLDLVARSPFQMESGYGPHPRCIGEAVGGSAETTWLAPTGIDSCLQWFAVDLLLDSGDIRAVSLDTWTP